MRRTVRRAFIVVGALLLVMAMALPASAKIEFHRIVYDPSGSDIPVSNWKLNREFVVLHNTGSRTRRIGNWRIRDLAGHRYTVPDGFRLGLTGTSACTPAGAATTAMTCIGGAAGTSGDNTGDRATLKNASGTVIDRRKYDGGGTLVNC